MPKIVAPYFPIIYVRGYAMTADEIANTVATPYMGFNDGATKVRQAWDKTVDWWIFESPLVRLMKDHKYIDAYENGGLRAGPLPARSILIHRYYDQADKTLGTGVTPSIEDAARSLQKLILQLRSQVCGQDQEALDAFKVHLVAHSMGGLICRCFLQNDDVTSAADRALVSKVFTYGTPHNGIDFFGLNVPTFASLFDLKNFNRTRMAEYLQLPPNSSRVDSLNEKFDPARFFCFVGTNAGDYTAGAGASKIAASELSDGLVRIENATVQGAPRAFAYRSHSGHFGIVNSEEGYQNLQRFLFGDRRVDGRLMVDAIPLPPSVKRAWATDEKDVRVSYFFEATVAPRAARSYSLTERRTETHSAVIRTFDELFEPIPNAERTAQAPFDTMFRPASTGGSHPRSPTLFSAFLDSRKIAKGSRDYVFSVRLAVKATDYVIDGLLWDKSVPGDDLFSDTFTISVSREADSAVVRYSQSSTQWPESRGSVVARNDDGSYEIPLSNKRGFAARLRLEVSETPDSSPQSAQMLSASPV